MKNLICFVLFLSFLIHPKNLVSQNHAYGINPFEAYLATVDLDILEIISEVDLTMAGETLTGGNGLSWNPIDGQLYCIVKVQGESGRVLGTVDPITGVVTRIGNTGDNFAGITFGTDGTLYGVTGDGASTPESLFTISTIDGTSTFKVALGAGSDGEVICFNPDDGLIYHGSGRNTNNAWESIDPVSNAITPIAITGYDWDELFGLYYAGNSTFLASNLDQELVEIMTDGSSMLLGSVSTAMDLNTMFFRGFVSTIGPGVQNPIPTLSEWSIITLALIMLIVGVSTLKVLRKYPISIH